jgi:hypothetical protein
MIDGQSEFTLVVSRHAIGDYNPVWINIPNWRNMLIMNESDHLLTTPLQDVEVYMRQWSDKVGDAKNLGWLWWRGHLVILDQIPWFLGPWDNTSVNWIHVIATLTLKKIVLSIRLESWIESVAFKFHCRYCFCYCVHRERLGWWENDLILSRRLADVSLTDVDLVGVAGMQGFDNTEDRWRVASIAIWMCSWLCFILHLFIREIHLK